MLILFTLAVFLLGMIVGAYQMLEDEERRR